MIVEDIAHDEGREAKRGLVQHEKLRPAHEGAPHGEHLALSAGEGAGELPPPLAQARKEREHLLERRRDGASPLGAAKEGAEPQIVLDAHAREKLALFRHEAEPGRDARLDREAFERNAREADMALRRQDAHDGVEQRRFSGPVGADHRGDASRFDGKRHAAHREHAAVCDGKIAKLEHRAHATAPR